MSVTPTLNHFDRSKPFYPLVTNYVLQFIGMKDVVVRGYCGARHPAEALQSFIKKTPLPHDPKHIQETNKFLIKLLGDLELYSEFQQNHIIINADNMAKEFVDHATYLLSCQMRASGNLFILAHEATKNQTCYDNSPLWEFLRHCRNAAAHNGRFSFRPRCESSGRCPPV